MAKTFGTHPQMPILYFTQVMGYSFGISPAKLNLDKHLTDAEKIFEKTA